MLYRVAGDLELSTWLRQQCADYSFGAGGVFLRDSDQATWPLTAGGPAELEARLQDGGHLLPLPKEPAALANILEVSILNFLEARISQVPGAAIQRGTERGYPDLEISGAAFGGGHHAIDVKAARRGKSLKQTQSAITLYTGNTYFKWPDLHWPGTFRPFNEYTSHLDLLLIYTLNEGSNARVEDLEVIVQEPWRIASRNRSSTTREYIGAVSNIADLREGRGAFETPAAFYDYWRKFPFKVSPQVQRQLQRLLASTQQELAVLRRQQTQPEGE
jgi:Restriction endonuclease EcoRV